MEIALNASPNAPTHAHSESCIHNLWQPLPTHTHTHMLSYSAQLLLLLPLHNIIMMLLNRQSQGGEAGRQAGRQGTRLKGSSHTACAHCASTIKPHFTLMIRQTDSQTDRRNGALAWELRFATISAQNCRALGAWANNGVERGKGVIASPNWIIMLICTYWERQVPRPQIAAIKNPKGKQTPSCPSWQFLLDSLCILFDFGSCCALLLIALLAWFIHSIYIQIRPSFMLQTGEIQFAHSFMLDSVCSSKKPKVARKVFISRIIVVIS